MSRGWRSQKRQQIGGLLRRETGKQIGRHRRIGQRLTNLDFSGWNRGHLPTGIDDLHRSGRLGSNRAGQQPTVGGEQPPEPVGSGHFFRRMLNRLEDFRRLQPATEGREIGPGGRPLPAVLVAVAAGEPRRLEEELAARAMNRRAVTLPMPATRTEAVRVWLEPTGRER